MIGGSSTTVIDEFLTNNDAYASRFAKGDLRLPPASTPLGTSGRKKATPTSSATPVAS